MTSYTDPGFGHFLSNDADLLAAYRAQTGAYLTDTSRVVDVWRMRGAAARDRFSPAEAERWLLDQPGADPVLHQLIHAVNESRQAGVPITVSTHGTVLTGLLIAEDAYFADLVEDAGTANDKGPFARLLGG